MLCIKCGLEIPKTRKSVKYCSQHCQKLYLKSLYRKRHKDEFNEYRRIRRKEGYVNFYKDCSTNKVVIDLKRSQGTCLRCGEKEGLEVHHIKPRMMGGNHKIGNVMLLCRKCHYDFEQLTKDFWEK